MNTVPHPIDFDAYSRGDLIPRSDIESAASTDGIDCDDEDALRFYTLSLKKRVQRELEARGRGLASIRIEQGGLRILNDGDDQSIYCEEDTRIAMRRVVNRHREMVAVDVSLLTDERRKRHHDMLIRLSRIIGESGYPRNRLPELPPVEEDDDS